MLDIIWEPIFYPKKILGSSPKIMGQYLKKYTPPRQGMVGISEFATVVTTYTRNPY
jgi:hypothetical protein